MPSACSPGRWTVSSPMLSTGSVLNLETICFRGCRGRSRRVKSTGRPAPLIHDEGKTMKTFKLLAVAALAASTLPAFAQTQSTPRIDQRQAEQQQRIEQGKKSGQLTKKEAAKLEKGQARIQKMENKAAADGKITKKERRQIEHAQDVESRRIYREKHDNQTRK